MADYWMKLYIEILDDPKMATLPDRVWRRVIELFLVAKRMGKDGHLPDTRQIAWMLRMNPDDLSMDLAQIAQTGIIVQEVGGWFIPKFAQRQAAVPDAERKAQERNRKNSQQYYGPVTSQSRNVTQSTEDRLTESETESETEAKAQAIPEPQAWKDDPTIDPPAPAAPAPYIHPTRKAESLILKCGRMAAVPSKELPRVEQVLSMIDKYGEGQVERALTEAFRKWVNTPRKSGGGNYSPLNFGWVDWAQEALMNVQADIKPAYHPNMSKEELMRYLGVTPE